MAKMKKPLIERAVLAIVKGIGDEITGEGFRLTLPALEDLDPDRFNRIELSCDQDDITISVFRGHNAVVKDVPEFDITRSPEGQEIPMALMVLDNFAEGKGPRLTKEDARRMAADIRKTFQVLSAPATAKVKMDDIDPDNLKKAFAFVPPTEGPLTFKTDYRVENPKLHALYRGYALETILVTQSCVKALYDMSRWPASDMAHILWERVKQEIVEDAAWFEAAGLIGMKIDLTPFLPEHSSPAVQEAVMTAQGG